MPEEGKKKNEEEIFEATIAKNFQINDSHQTTDPGSSENSRQHKHKKSTHTYILFELQAPKTENILKTARRKKLSNP